MLRILLSLSPQQLSLRACVRVCVSLSLDFLLTQVLLPSSTQMTNFKVPLSDVVLAAFKFLLRICIRFERPASRRKSCRLFASILLRFVLDSPFDTSRSKLSLSQHCKPLRRAARQHLDNRVVSCRRLDERAQPSHLL